MAEWLGGLPPARRIWIAHSFGCRVGLQLAARHPETLAGLFLIAAAGLPPQRTPWARARVAVRRWAFRLARQFTPEGPARDRLRARFGSADYRAAGPLRPILVKAVSEDLTAVAERGPRSGGAGLWRSGPRDPAGNGHAPPQPDAAVAALCAARLRPLEPLDRWTPPDHPAAERIHGAIGVSACSR